ncbi:MAG: squalene--hopene cyclase, partial [Pirellulaceae bacterium]
SGGFDGFGESLARSSIATLVFSIAKRKDLKQYKAALGYIDDQLEGSASSWPEYARYYQAQALFQGNVDLWRKWNASTIRQLKSMQKEDGSFTGQLGPTTNTSMALLALALNYRFLPIYER